jgi:HPt (histidine-containing phosphotransfer) domain-containing protein
MSNRGNTESILDHNALDELRACDPDGTGLLAELIDIWISDTPPRLAALRLAFEAGQPAALSREAHALKSGSAQLGACAVAATCRELEYLGRDGSLAGVEERLARLQREFENARNALLALKQG